MCIPENIGCTLRCSSRHCLDIHGWWSKWHASHQYDRSLCSSSEVIYILLHAQLLTIRQVECRWSLWKTWAINSHNKDKIPSHSKVSINVMKDGKTKRDNSASTSFNFLSWGTYQKGHSESVVKIRDSHWDKIILSTWVYYKASFKLPKSTELIIIDDDEVVQDFNSLYQQSWSSPLQGQGVAGGSWSWLHNESWRGARIREQGLDMSM